MLERYFGEQYAYLFYNRDGTSLKAVSELTKVNMPTPCGCYFPIVFLGIINIKNKIINILEFKIVAHF